MKCRHCSAALEHTLIDLGSAPPSNSYLTSKTTLQSEKYYPLKVLICDQCWLVQTEDFVGASELFTDDYAYFSSYSSSWLEHTRDYVDKIVDRLGLFEKSRVVEIAANDGYLLQYIQAKGIPCYGIEPTHSTANAAKKKGLEIIEKFFSLALAKDLVQQTRQADLIVANNVLAHVPDINDFVKGCAILLNPSGIATFEFPHLLTLVEQNQFDTIYHEHFSYLSLTALLTIFKANELKVFHVEELPTHGGSLRVYATHVDCQLYPQNATVKKLLAKEGRAGVNTLSFYRNFQGAAEKTKLEFSDFLSAAKTKGKNVAAYGAAAKGNTLLNYAGIQSDLVSFVVDRNPEKQGKYMPGSHIRIMDEILLKEERPDYVVILPWNLKDEVMSQLNYIRSWGGKFITAVPHLELL